MLLKEWITTQSPGFRPEAWRPAMRWRIRERDCMCEKDWEGLWAEMKTGLSRSYLGPSKIQESRSLSGIGMWPAIGKGILTAVKLEA